VKLVAHEPCPRSASRARGRRPNVTVSRAAGDEGVYQLQAVQAPGAGRGRGAGTFSRAQADLLDAQENLRRDPRDVRTVDWTVLGGFVVGTLTIVLVLILLMTIF
jgi:hypothetical protein